MRSIYLTLGMAILVILVTYGIWGGAEASLERDLRTLVGQPKQYALFSFGLLASDIILPVPNSIVMYTNGFMLGWGPGALLSLLSLMFGATAGYWLGRFTSLGLRAQADRQATLFIEKYGPLAILVTRGIPVVSESICFVGGYNRMPVWQYLLLNLLGYIPVCLLYAFFGSWGFSENVFMTALLCSFLMAGVFWWVGKRFYGQRR